MITRMYTIRDIIANSYTIPVAYPNDATARRHFEILKEDQQSIMGARPQDYEMYYCGEYDMTTGQFTAEYPLIRIDTIKGGTDV